jgi:hypothetical protein
MTQYDAARRFWDLLRKRRTRRHARGLAMPAGGPLAGVQGSTTKPLEDLQEAYLALAAVGIIGPSLAEVPFQNDAMGGGNIISRFVSRTAISPDAAHTVGLFVINDAGVSFVRRPHNLTLSEWNELKAYRDGSGVLQFYQQLLVPVSHERPAIADERPHVPTFNRWASNKPGTTYFVPVLELSELYLSALFGGLQDAAGYFLLDERNGLAPAGLATFAKSEGGWLEDDVLSDRVFTVDGLDTSVAMFAAVELGAVLQNMSLMAQALGVGGWPHYASGTRWLQRLGFDSCTLKASRVLGLPASLAADAQLRGKDRDLWSPLGFPQLPLGSAKDDSAELLIKPYCPPYYNSMEDAVRAFCAHKFGPEGRLSTPFETAWKDHSKVVKAIPRYTEPQIEAAAEHAQYIYDRYGRFPAKFGPVVTLNAFQAHNLETSFYDEFYGEEQRSGPKAFGNPGAAPEDAAAAPETPKLDAPATLKPALDTSEGAERPNTAEPKGKKSATTRAS